MYTVQLLMKEVENSIVIVSGVRDVEKKIESHQVIPPTISVLYFEPVS